MRKGCCWILRITRKFFARMTCCGLPVGGGVKKCLVGLLFITAGLVCGVLLNRYGYLLETIRVEISMKELRGSYEFRRLNLSEIYAQNSTEYVVPNLVHFVWFGDVKEMTFLNYISIYSAYKHQKPDAIMFHCDHLPIGQWWNRLSSEVPLRIVRREAPKEIFNQTILHIYHKGDVAKLRILMEYGGIYLDNDVIVLRSLDELRTHPCTLGQEKRPKFNAGVIVAHKDSLFLKLWYNSYKDNYRPLDWDFNCARLIYQLYLQRPDLLQVEKRRLTTPDWLDRHLLWKETIDWSDLFVIHVMGHLDFTEYTPENIRALNSTFGAAMRYIYYGSPKSS